MSWKTRALLGLCLALTARPALAHKPSDSYLTLTVSGPTIEARWDVAIRDLEDALGIDLDADGKVTWGELEARRGQIEAYVLSKLVLEADGRVCPISARAFQTARHSDGGYAVLTFAARCAAPPASLSIKYTLFFERDPQHRGLVRLFPDRTGVVSSGERTLRFELGAGARTGLTAMLGNGVAHIFSGIDHLLFLIALLLAAVLRRDGAGWVPVAKLRPALADVVKIVSAFTVAHSITLTLGALGVVALPSRFVESAIAASVVLAALNNLFPVLGRDRWVAAFALGLLHGFGFSAALVDLGLSRAALIWPLLGFNLGVELGQLTVVAVFMPLAFLARRRIGYQRVLLQGGSVVIALIAAVWLVERAFDLKIFPT